MSLNDPSLLKTQAFVAGEWIDADSGDTFDVVDPADGSVVASVADLGVEETRRAIAAADAAQREWAKKTAKDRGVVLDRTLAGNLTLLGRVHGDHAVDTCVGRHNTDGHARHERDTFSEGQIVDHGRYGLF